jgi:hypothetical protein
MYNQREQEMISLIYLTLKNTSDYNSKKIIVDRDFPNIRNNCKYNGIDGIINALKTIISMYYEKFLVNRASSSPKYYNNRIFDPLMCDDVDIFMFDFFYNL